MPRRLAGKKPKDSMIETPIAAPPAEPPPEGGHPRLHQLMHWLVGLRGSPEAIARGIAIGLFVAFTPTIGLQLILAAALATLLGASRAAAIVPVWITNPVTIPPIYGFTYMVGSWFFPGPPANRMAEVLSGLVTRLRKLEFWDIIDQVRAVMALGRDIFIPLWIGGVVVGLTVALVVYFPAVVVVRRSREFMRRHRPHFLRHHDNE
jgi:uncharacterized protein